MAIKRVSNGGVTYYLPRDFDYEKGDKVEIIDDPVFEGTKGIVVDITSDMIYVYIKDWGDVPFFPESLKRC